VAGLACAITLGASPADFLSGAVSRAQEHLWYAASKSAPTFAAM
jgi:hypothetical protein